MAAPRPSDPLKDKSNVNASLNRPTEATAEDFKEISSLFEWFADWVDDQVQPEKFYQFHTSLENLAAAHPDAVEDGWAIIVPSNGNTPFVATFTNGEWVASQVQPPVQLVNTKLDRPDPGQEGVFYIVKDEKLISLWYNNKYNDFGKDGNNGLSAYQVAVAFGFEGTEPEWLASLVGKSAYQSAVDNGFEGTEAEWVESIGGVEGKSAFEVAQDDGFAGTKTEWLETLIGPEGKSAYKLAQDDGFAGTVSEWLESLIGEPGPQGLNNYELWLEEGNQGSFQDYLETLRGPAGEVTLAQLEAAKQEAINEAKAYSDSLHVGTSDSITDSYDTMAALYADQDNQIDGELFVVVDASTHSTVDAGWAFFEYLGSTTGTEIDYRKLSEEESLDAASGGGGADGSIGQAKTGYLDTVNGDDTTAVLETVNKPFKTFDALVSAIPDVEYWTIIILSAGNVPVNNQIQNKNLTIDSRLKNTLDFSNITGSVFSSPSTRDFILKNGNISLRISNTSDANFRDGGNANNIRIAGFIDKISFRPANSHVVQNIGSLKINEIETFTDLGGEHLSIAGAYTKPGDIMEIGYINLRSNCRPISTNLPTTIFKIEGTAPTQVAYSSGNNFNGNLTIKEFGVITGSIFINGADLNLDGCKIADGNIITLHQCNYITGRVKSGTGKFRVHFNYDGCVFEDFTGRFDYYDIRYADTSVEFRDCYIMGSGANILRSNAGSGKIIFKGNNIIEQEGSGQFIANSVANIEIWGDLKSNIAAIGSSTITDKTPNKYPL